MKTGVSLLVVTVLCGCVYDVPLVEKAAVAVDPALIGTWQLVPDDGKPENPTDRMTILPFDANEYAVICSPQKDLMVFRAYPVQLDGREFVQLEWLQAGPEQNRYHVCRYALQSGALTVETLNEKVVGPEIDRSDALRKTFLANRDNPDLFCDPQQYRKVAE